MRFVTAVQAREKDLDGGQRHHRAGVIVCGTSVSSLVVFEKMKKLSLEFSQRLSHLFTCAGSDEGRTV